MVCFEWVANCAVMYNVMKKKKNPQHAIQICILNVCHMYDIKHHLE